MGVGITRADLFVLIGAGVVLLPSALAAQQFEGVSVCRKCHIDQAQSWAETVHAKALSSLKPNEKADAKRKANLDPAKDYTTDPDCLTCHTTGYGKPGGYTVAMPAAEIKNFAVVGCESCHGAGSQYRHEHGAAEQRWKTGGGESERAALVRLGQSFDYERACATCHLNYEGSRLSGVHPPFTPFTPTVDSKYAFNYLKEVLRSGKASGMHDHFKLKGVFKGDPIPEIRAKTQADAKEIE